MTRLASQVQPWAGAELRGDTAVPASLLYQGFHAPRGP